MKLILDEQFLKDAMTVASEQMLREIPCGEEQRHSAFYNKNP